MTRRKQILRAFILGAVPIGAYLYPWAFDGPTLCVVRRLTGIPCPGCGLTRAFYCVAHGRVLESIRHNPFGVVFFGVVILLFGITLWDIARGTDIYHRVVSNKRLSGALLGALVIFGMARVFYVLAFWG